MTSPRGGHGSRRRADPSRPPRRPGSSRGRRPATRSRRPRSSPPASRRPSCHPRQRPPAASLRDVRPARERPRRPRRTAASRRPRLRSCAGRVAGRPRDEHRAGRLVDQRGGCRAHEDPARAAGAVRADDDERVALTLGLLDQLVPRAASRDLGRRPRRAQHLLSSTKDVLRGRSLDFGIEHGGGDRAGRHGEGQDGVVHGEQRQLSLDERRSLPDGLVPSTRRARG